MAKRKTSVAGRKKSQGRAKVSVGGAEPYQPKMSTVVARSAVETSIGQRIKLSDYRATVTPLTRRKESS
jgi:hypothetical protein